MSKLAWIGLGVMGYPIAGHIKDSGHDVTVFNRTCEKAERWVAEHGGAFASTPAEAAEAPEQEVWQAAGTIAEAARRIPGWKASEERVLLLVADVESVARLCDDDGLVPAPTPLPGPPREPRHRRHPPSGRSPTRYRRCRNNWGGAYSATGRGP